MKFQLNRALDAIDTYLLKPGPSKLVSRLRLKLWAAQGASIGRGVTLGSGVHLVGKSGLTLNDRVSIARDVTLDARGGLTLEEDVLVGFESVILTSTHNSDSFGVPIQEQGMFYAESRIGRNVWLGTRVIVQPGILIGHNSIIGSGSIVTKDIPEASVAVGSPARVIRNRA